MWTCQECGENIDEAADVCWSCGTSKARVEDPTLHRMDAPGVDDEASSSAEGQLDETLSCRTCGSKLRNLHRDSVCPECGTTVNWSPHGDLLRFSDPAWVRTLATGMGWIVAGAVCCIILGLYADTHRTIRATWLLGIHMHRFLPSPGIPVALMGLIGCWKVTTPDAGKTDTEGTFAARKLARVWVITAFVWIAVWAQLTLAAALPLDQLFVQVLGVAVGLLATIALLAYVRRLALRLPRKGLAIETQILKWGVAMLLLAAPLLEVLDEVGWLLLPMELPELLALASLILVIWMVVLTIRYWTALDRAARIAAAEDMPAGPGRIRFTAREVVPGAGMVCALLAVWGGVAFFWSYQQVSRLKEELRDENPLVRRRALSAFGRYGRAAVPPLIDALEDVDPKVRESAAYTLCAKVGRSAVPALIELLNDNDARLRRWGATPPIRGAGGQTPALFHKLRTSQTGRSLLRGNCELIAALDAALKDEDEVVRFYAAYALGLRYDRNELEEGSGGKPLSYWIENLTHKNPNARLWAAYYVGAKDKAAVSALIEALTHKDANVRRWAAGTLRQIGPDAKEAVPALVELLKGEENVAIREEAVWALAQIGRAGDVWGDPRLVKAAVPALIGAMKDDDRHYGHYGRAWWAATTLGQIGPEAREAVPALIEARKDGKIRSAATEALKKIDPGTAAKVLGIIGPDASEPVRALIVVLTDEEASQRNRAAQFLGLIGPDADEAVPILVEMLKDKEVGETAAEALARIGVTAVPRLIVAARDEDTLVRVPAIRALGEIGPAASQAVPVLIDAFESEDISIRLVGAVSLGQLGPSAEKAVPLLVQGLEDNNRHVRVHSADALRSLGWQGREKLLAVLIEGLNDGDACACAVAALSEFGPEASEAAPALIEIAKNRKLGYSVSRAAIKALKEIDPEAAAEAGLK